MTDKELEQIYNEGYKAVYWTAMSFLKNEADAEDVVQDTFVTLIKSYDTINDKSKVLPWLKKTAANKCLDRIKLKKTDIMDDEFFDTIEAVPEDFLPDSIIESAEMRKIVMDIINNTLSEDTKRTLILFYFNEMSTKEIAQAQGIPEGTVSRRMNFARNKIKKEVERYEEENDTKLFGMAMPFLSMLFMKEAEQVPFKAIPASLTALSASASASAKAAGHAIGKKIVAGTVKKGAGLLKTKILIGGTAALVATGTAVGIYVGVTGGKNDSDRGGKPRHERVERMETEEAKPERSDAAHPVSISFVGLTEDEIVENVHNVILIDSEIIDDSYGDRFSIYAGFNNFIYTWDLDTLNIPEGITLVSIACAPDEHERITVRPNTNISIAMRFDNVERAAYVYDALVDLLANEDPDHPRTPSIDDREGDSWQTIFLAHHVGMNIFEGDAPGDPPRCDLFFLRSVETTY